MDDIEKLKSENISLRRALEDEQIKLDTVLQSIIDGVYATQKQLERQKEDFYSRLIHDLKSPLQVIMGYAELMNSMPPAELSRNSTDFLNIILLNCSSMHSLINDFLSISRLEPGSMHLDLRNSNLTELVKRVHDNYMPSCLKKDISLKAVLPGSFRESILDEKLIERALANLVSNAVEFTPRRGTVSISLSEEDGFAVMTVSDTGPGISPDDIGLVFEKRCRTKPTAGADGTGNGLAMVTSIVEAHGGSVAMESAPGKGRKFTINLPINNPSERT